MKPYSRLYARIDLDAAAFNFASMKRAMDPKAKMIAVIKADGYGHGAVQIARLAEDYDYIWGFATATAEEAWQLRRAGIRKPILILGYVFEEHYEMLVKEEIRPAVFLRRQAQALEQAAARLGRVLPVHLALDTGMSRIGLADDESGIAAAREIAQLPHLRIEGLFTHFARADETDKEPALRQLARYQAFARRLEREGVGIPLHHVSNSAGIIDLPEAHLDLVRAGISIYGLYPSEEVQKERVPLKSVMELKSHITYIKEVMPGTPVSYGGTFVTGRRTRIATIPAGYADGYPRLLSGKGRVLIRGRSAPILGRVCMDQFMVDVTEIPDAKELDEVTLLGCDGGEQVTAQELGDLSGRFPYELVCDISRRVPRVYVKDGAVTEQKDFFDVY